MTEPRTCALENDALLRQVKAWTRQTYLPFSPHGYTVRMRPDLWRQLLGEFITNTPYIVWETLEGLRIYNVVFVPRKERP